MFIIILVTVFFGVASTSSVPCDEKCFQDRIAQEAKDTSAGR